MYKAPATNERHINKGWTGFREMMRVKRHSGVNLEFLVIPGDDVRGGDLPVGVESADLILERLAQLIPRLVNMQEYKKILG